MNPKLDLNTFIKYYKDEINDEPLKGYYEGIGHMAEITFGNNSLIDIVGKDCFYKTGITYEPLTIGGFFKSVEITGENMETFQFYEGVVVRRSDLEVVVDGVWIINKDKLVAERELLLVLVDEVGSDNIGPLEDYEFILIPRGTVTRTVK